VLHERDVILINSLQKAPGRKVVGVVGIAHLDGIVRYWDRLESRMAELGMDRDQLV